MKNLVNVTSNPLDHLISIIGDKDNPTRNNRRDRLNLLVPSLAKRYAEYTKNFSRNNLEGISTQKFSDIDKEDIHHCYSSETQSLNKLIKLIKEVQHWSIQGLCQFCGINTDSTTDHYLPKGPFPEFCVHALNLFPCCPDCNSYKGEYWFDKLSTTRGIVNLYLDPLPDVQFLFAAISFQNNIPTLHLRLQNTNGIRPELYSIIENHFKRLHLIERYADNFNSLYNQTYKAFVSSSQFSGNPKAVSDFLREDAQSLFIDYGRNYYKGIIKESLAGNIVFTNQFI